MDSNTSRVVAVALTLAGAALAGCGSSNDAPTDAGSDVSTLPVDAGPTDAGQPVVDAGQDAADDAGPAVDCGAVTPAGKQIVASTSTLVIQGTSLTGDGYAFYDDTVSQTLYAVAATGGTPSSLGVVTSQAGTFHLNGGKAALFLPSATNPVTETAPLSVWTAAKGANAISTTAFAYDSYFYTYDSSQDGTLVGYFITNGGLGTLAVSASDGSNPKTLVENIDLFSNQSCSPMVQFVGNTLVAYYCLASVPTVPSDDAGADAAADDAGDAAADDAGPQITAGELIVTSFLGSSFTPTPIATFPAPTTNTPLNAPYGASPDGTQLFVSVPTGGLALYPIAGGAPTVIDPKGTGGGFTSSGGIIYSTTASSVIYLPPAAEDAGADAGLGAAVTIISKGVGGLLTLSGDGNWSQSATQNSGQFYDIDLLSVKGGTLATEWAQPTAFPTGFSADSKYETFETNFPPNFGITTFDFEASPVSGGAPTKIFTGSGALAFTTGSKLVASLNPNPTTGSADIDSVDLSNPATPSTVVSQADPNFFYSSATNQVFYTWHCAPTAPSGLWVVTAP